MNEFYSIVDSEKMIITTYKLMDDNWIFYKKEELIL